MSANNWAKCPRCKANRILAAQEAEAEVQASYGQVPLDEFNQLRAHADALALAVDSGRETYREDYEVYGAEDGEIIISYSGSCDTCGLAASFEHRRPLS